MSIELPASSRHRRDMTERFLKATLSSNQTNSHATFKGTWYAWYIFSHFNKEGTFCICFPAIQARFEKGFTQKKRNCSPCEHFFFLLEWIPFQKEGKTILTRVAPSESVSVRFKRYNYTYKGGNSELTVFTSIQGLTKEKVFLFRVFPHWERIWKVVYSKMKQFAPSSFLLE